MITLIIALLYSIVTAFNVYATGNNTFQKMLLETKDTTALNLETYYRKSDNNTLGTVKKKLELIVEKHKNHPNIDRVLYDIGSIYFLLEDFDNSYKHFYALLNKNSKLKGSSLYFIAKILIIQKQYVKARKLIRSYLPGLKNDTYLLRLIYLVAEARFYEKSYKKTITILTTLEQREKMLQGQIDNIMPAIYLRLGQSNFYLKQNTNAKKYFSLVIEKYPTLLEANFAENWINMLDKSSNLVTKDSVFSSLVIQIGVFSKYRNALEIKRTLESLNLLPSIVSKPDNQNSLYKVILPVASKEIAQNILDTLEKHKIKALLITK